MLDLLVKTPLLPHYICPTLSPLPQLKSHLSGKCSQLQSLLSRVCCSSYTHHWAVHFFADCLHHTLSVLPATMLTGRLKCSSAAWLSGWMISFPQDHLKARCRFRGLHSHPNQRKPTTCPDFMLSPGFELGKQPSILCMASSAHTQHIQRARIFTLKSRTLPFFSILPQARTPMTRADPRSYDNPEASGIRTPFPLPSLLPLNFNSPVSHLLK